MNRNGAKRHEKAPKDTRREALELAIAVGGGMTALARRLQIKPDAVQKWRTRGVTAERAKQLEELTGVSRKRLRPDIFG